MSARCNRPLQGLVAILVTEADCQLSMDGTDMYLECKRIGSKSKIEANAKKASSQIETCLRKGKS